MYKFLMWILSTCCLFSGCALKKEGKPSAAQLDSGYMIESSNDMNAFYNTDGTHRYHYPPDSFYSAEETRFYIEDNPCIYADYIIGKVAMSVEEVLLVAIGSHCFGDSFDGIVMLNPKDIKIVNYEKIEYQSLVKIHYSFPTNFIPTDYLDFVDYMTYLEPYN